VQTQTPPQAQPRLTNDMGKIVKVVEKFLRDRATRALGNCFSFNPKTVVDESGVYAAPITISVVKYVLNVAVANNAMFVLTGYHSDSNRYLLCRDSPLWGNPELLEEMVRNYERNPPTEYWVEFHSPGDGVWLYTTNDVANFDAIYRVIHSVIDNDGVRNIPREAARRLSSAYRVQVDGLRLILKPR
jgi:hypothetical protein